MKKYQIFISSTFTDLIDERQAAVEAILQAGHIPAGMELFAASNQSQWEIIKKWIDESDIYMLILGGRYGSIEPESGLSYTELEYNYACDIGKPLFALVLHDDFIEQKVQKQGSKNIRELNEPQKLHSFSKNVLSKLCKICSDYKDIQLGVFQSITSLERENNLTGWIKSDKDLNAQPYLDQISALQKEKEVLLLENQKLKRTNPSNTNSSEFQKILKCLIQEEIDLTNLKKIDTSYPEKTTVYQAFEAFKEIIIVGVTNNINATATDMFVFRELAPKLQIHGLTKLEKVNSTATARRYILSEKGQKFLSYIAIKSLDANLPSKYLQEPIE